jgi:hypothetical protein
MVPAMEIIITRTFAAPQLIHALSATEPQKFAMMHKKFPDEQYTTEVGSRIVEIEDRLVAAGVCESYSILWWFESDGMLF